MYFKYLIPVVTIVLMIYSETVSAREMRSPEGVGRDPMRGERHRETERSREKRMKRAMEGGQNSIDKCARHSEVVRNSFRQMHRELRGKAAQKGEIQRLRREIRQEIRKMDMEHHNFVSSLNDNQRKRVHGRLRSLRQLRTRLENQFRVMDGELSQGNINREQARKQVREMEQLASRMMKSYREIQKAL